MRTVKDFVKELFLKGKSPAHIRAVATCSRWKDQMDKVDKWIEKGKKIMKKRKSQKHHKPSSKGKKTRVLRIRKKSTKSFLKKVVGKHNFKKIIRYS